MSKELYTKQELAKMKDQKNPWVVYLIFRKSAKMSVGKIAVQAAHAATIISEKRRQYEASSGKDNESVKKYSAWVKESMRKISKTAPDIKFEKIKEGFPDCCVVRDAGLTEVDPGTETVLVLWPMRKDDTPDLIHKLPNL